MSGPGVSGQSGDKKITNQLSGIPEQLKLTKGEIIMNLGNLEVWVKGLVSAAVSSAAGSVTVVVVDPVTFNLQDGLAKLGTVAAISALIAVANYLKQSPLPSA